MRIGIDVGRVLHGDGGVAVYTRRLVMALAEHGSALEILLFDLDRGVSDRRAHEAAFGGLPEQVDIGVAASNDLSDLDVFHAPGFRMPPSGSPSHVFTLHDLTALSHPQFHKLDNRVRSLTSTSEALARGATILAVSQATRNEAVRLLAMPQEQIEVVPPILGEHFTAQSTSSVDEERLERIGLEGPYALAVASLEPRKNFSRLLDAWDELPADLTEAHQLVVVVSTQWLQGAVRRRLAKMGRSGSVLLLDHLPARDLAALYRGARTLVFPSLAEGFGLPVAEAMACGAPVVTSDRSSMPEVAGGGAVLVDPEDVSSIADGIERVLSDQSLRRDLRERGFESASRFTADVVVPKLIEVYRRTAKRSRVGLRHV
jgi:alpha-1,3-rhamnosyl/mannosyltransferase